MANRLLQFRAPMKCPNGHIFFTTFVLSGFACGPMETIRPEECKCELWDTDRIAPNERFIGRASFDGKPMYEGDWVRVEIDDTFEEVTKTALIVWNNSCAAFYYDFGSVSIPVMDDRITDPVIIGNIHESPEPVEADDEKR